MNTLTPVIRTPTGINGFTSLAQEMQQLLELIVKTPELHCKWINTLSSLENSGAKKIAACEHPTLVKEEILKHASEEFRHAYYLKRQIGRVAHESFPNYSFEYILGGVSSLHYLNALDLKASRYLKNTGISKSAIKEASYLLVTYAIELRAGEIYPIYEEILRKTGSRVTVKSILIEEKEHLEEMIEGLHKLPGGFIHAKEICAFESELCQKWLQAVENDIIIDYNPMHIL